jgi:hypothetical protein
MSAIRAFEPNNRKVRPSSSPHLHTVSNIRVERECSCFPVPQTPVADFSSAYVYDEAIDQRAPIDSVPRIDGDVAIDRPSLFDSDLMLFETSADNAKQLKFSNSLL